ncbi:MAG: hypothetical protein FWB92_00600 [Oscillospiraceae bacterium]|nr:hypothetical protein [Oscillospiraceae bacterium]
MFKLRKTKLECIKEWWSYNWRANLLFITTVSVSLTLFYGLVWHPMQSEIVGLSRSERIEAVVISVDTMIEPAGILGLSQRQVFIIVAEATVDGERHVFFSQRISSVNPEHEFPVGSTILVRIDPYNLNVYQVLTGNLR